MKIAILTRADVMYRVFRPLMDKLKSQGHECLFVACNPLTLPQNDHKMVFCKWDSFNFAPIDKFKPDRVIIFNGRFPDIISASYILSEKYPTHLCEIAWFPQTHNLYFGKQGIAELSELSKATPSFGNKAFDPAWDTLKRLYRSNPLPEHMAGAPYVAIPLQIEWDTSIIHGSPYMQKMQHFIDWCAATAGGRRLIFKTHPKCAAHKALNFGAHEVDPAGVTMNDLVANSAGVVGINSTSLIEALIHQKPIVQIGVNVAMRDKAQAKRHFVMGLDAALTSATKHHMPEFQKGVACMLYLNQCPTSNPPQWVIDAIINDKQTPKYGEIL